MERDQVEEEADGEELQSFLITQDPGPYPLRYRLELSSADVFFGLVYGGFYPGTVLMDQADGRQYIVRARRKQLILEPSCERIWLYAYQRNYISLEELHRYIRAGSTPPAGQVEE